MRRFSKWMVSGSIVFGLLGGGMPASADVAPEGEQECDGKAPGDDCEGGACRAQTCSRLDYANWDRDSDAGPPVVTYPCVLCVPKVSDAGATDAGRRQDGGSAAMSTEGSGCGGCSTGGRALGLRGAALGFALFMGLILGGRRKKKPR